MERGCAMLQEPKNYLLFKAIELIGGPCDGIKLHNCIDNLHIKDESGVMRLYVAGITKTKDGRVRFYWDGLKD
jgi:hypothetical protein